MGARQLVVHEALETIVCPGRRACSLTPRTTVRSSSLAGAEISTFCAPADRWAAASSRRVNSPVDSTTISTPASDQGRLAGSRSA